MGSATAHGTAWNSSVLFESKGCSIRAPFFCWDLKSGMPWNDWWIHSLERPCKWWWLWRLISVWRREKIGLQIEYWSVVGPLPLTTAYRARRPQRSQRFPKTQSPPLDFYARPIIICPPCPLNESFWLYWRYDGLLKNWLFVGLEGADVDHPNPAKDIHDPSGRQSSPRKYLKIPKQKKVMAFWVS